jgi:prepilin-type N-terminal cleavage/methylation domain-containing protein
MRSEKQGFTLIELLIVVVIIGILAAIAIPKFANTKEKAVVSAMRSDLRNLASVQETYWTNNATYYGGVIPDLPNYQFQPSQNITITVVSADPAGWSAQATAPGYSTQTCAIFYGTAPAIPPAKVDAAVACT